MNKWTEIFVGLILVLAAIIIAFYSQTWGIWNFWTAAGEFLKGGIFWFVIGLGALFILLGISDLKENTPRSEPKSSVPRGRGRPPKKQ